MDKPEAAKFNQWLRSMGAEVLLPTNPYELSRFIANGGTHVIYVNKKGAINALGFSLECIKAFKAGKTIDMGYTKTARTPNAKRKAVLLKRDGRDCFYCGLPMNDNEITVEHLIALDNGGNNRLENLMLAHEKCNNEVGNLPLTIKLNKRDRMRGFVKG